MDAINNSAKKKKKKICLTVKSVRKLEYLSI